MLTGDKLETATCTAKNAHLVTRNQDIHVFRLVKPPTHGPVSTLEPRRLQGPPELGGGGTQHLGWDRWRSALVWAGSHGEAGAGMFWGGWELLAGALGQCCSLTVSERHGPFENYCPLALVGHFLHGKQYTRPSAAKALEMKEIAARLAPFWKEGYWAASEKLAALVASSLF